MNVAKLRRRRREREAAGDYGRDREGSEECLHRSILPAVDTEGPIRRDLRNVHAGAGTTVLDNPLKDLAIGCYALSSIVKAALTG
jgi:hypothetical protein